MKGAMLPNESGGVNRRVTAPGGMPSGLDFAPHHLAKEYEPYGAPPANGKSSLR